MNIKGDIMKQNSLNLIHNIDPVFDENSQVLILGSFPSAASRHEQFFYAHPQNRFWRLISVLSEEELPVTVQSKKAILLRHGIALWDVISECEITGSSDSSIKNAVPNNIDKITETASIKRIFLNGGKAYSLYKKYFSEKVKLDYEKLPSTSPANARCGFEALCEKWGVIKPFLL